MNIKICLLMFWLKLEKTNPVRATLVVALNNINQANHKGYPYIHLKIVKNYIKSNAS